MNIENTLKILGSTIAVIIDVRRIANNGRDLSPEKNNKESQPMNTTINIANLRERMSLCSQKIRRQVGRAYYLFDLLVSNSPGKDAQNVKEVRLTSLFFLKLIK
jgi:hypothetical protein